MARIEDLLHYPGAEGRRSDVPETYICSRCSRSWPSKSLAVLHFVEAHITPKMVNGWVKCPICGFPYLLSVYRVHVLGCAEKHFIELGRARVPAPRSTVSGG